MPDTTSNGSPASTSPISSSPTPTSPTQSIGGNGPRSNSDAGTIVGYVIGAIIGLLLVGVLAYYLIFRRYLRALRGRNQDNSQARPPVDRQLYGFRTSDYHVPTLGDLSDSTPNSRELYVRNINLKFVCLSNAEPPSFGGLGPGRSAHLSHRFVAYTPTTGARRHCVDRVQRTPANHRLIQNGPRRDYLGSPLMLEYIYIITCFCRT